MANCDHPFDFAKSARYYNITSADEDALGARSEPQRELALDACETKLAAMKRFRVAARRTALQPPKTKHRQECLTREPVSPFLRAIDLQECVHFRTSLLCVHRDIDVRLSETAIPFRNLVLEHYLIPESIPDDLVDDAMILMPVVALVTQDQIWPGSALERFAEFLNLSVRGWELPIRKLTEQEFAAVRGQHEHPHRERRLLAPLCGSAQDYPIDHEPLRAPL